MLKPTIKYLTGAIPVQLSSPPPPTLFILIDDDISDIKCLFDFYGYTILILTNESL